ncbi:MAG: ion transporter [Clostridia bacterium]|nr:ion transporter [Clostridia bacterium]
MSRKRLFEIIEKSDAGDVTSTMYDAVIIVMVFLSLVPMVFKQEIPAFLVTDKIAGAIFIADYLLRFATADYKYGEHTVYSFFRYPFGAMAIMDLLSIIPVLAYLSESLHFLNMLRICRALRITKIFRYSKTIMTLSDVLKESKRALFAVAVLAISYILVCALIVFNAEPDSFNNFFDAVYWSTVLLTTVGFGDIVPVTAIGRFIAMASSIFGIAIVALPSGIITAGYMQVINEQKEWSGKGESHSPIKHDVTKTIYKSKKIKKEKDNEGTGK